MKVSRVGITIAALPGIVMLALYYSLAIHMFHSLGTWPTSIGERGFSSALATHCVIAVNFYQALFLSMFLLPVPILVSLWVDHSRCFGRAFGVYFVAYAIVLLLCFMVMQIAPAQFLYWWRD